MKIVCLDLEGVLVPEIWIAFSEITGVPEFCRTTRDEPDYDKLMRYRLDLLKEHNLKLPDIERAISSMEPLPGAVEFTKKLKERTQLIILSDTYEEFAKPLMEKLAWPTLFCNSLEINKNGEIAGYRLRQKEGKKHAVAALHSINIKVFAAGDAFNDALMIKEADSGCFFRAAENVRLAYPEIPVLETYNELLEKIDTFLLA